MKPWKRLASAPIPGTEDTLDLYGRDRDFYFRVNGVELMSSRMHGSEEILAELACQRIATVEAPRLLIGGLGMGYTLARALARLPEPATVEVVELIEEVIAWNRGPLAELTAAPLDDPRVAIHQGDVAAYVRGAQDRYDAILLDVDNGPAGLTRADNARLYSRTGLAALRAALRRDGVLLVWSAAQEPQFLRRVHGAGFAVEEIRVRARRDRGPRRTIYLATRGVARARPRRAVPGASHRGREH